MAGHRFFTLDVFTDTPLAGNPLAVVLDSDDLDTPRMQAIAGEFNLSETVFVRAPTRRGSRASVRIFTPVHEMPFAGHPLIGTASLLALCADETAFSLDAPIGEIACRTRRLSEDRASARFALPKRATNVAGGPEPAKIAAALGLVPEEIGWQSHRPSRFDAGAQFDCIPVRDLSVLAKAAPQRPEFDRVFAPPAGLVYLYTPGRNGDAHWRSRMFAPGYGVPEDPATGSAAAAFTGVLEAYHALHEGENTVAIDQGVEMGRPSRLNLELTVQDGKLQAAFLGGAAVIMSEGRLRV